MNDFDILTRIQRFCQSTLYCNSCGTEEVKSYAKGYRQGYEDAKMRILEIINSEN